MATKLDLAGDWNQLKSRIQSKWSHITDDLMERSKGNIDSLVSAVSRATGEARENVQAYVDVCMEQGSNLYSRASDAVRYGTKSVVDSASQMGDSLRTGATEAGKRIKERPLESVLLTLGVGVLAGIAMSMFMSSRSR